MIVDLLLQVDDVDFCWVGDLQGLCDIYELGFTFHEERAGEGGADEEGVSRGNPLSSRETYDIRGVIDGDR